MTTEIQENQNRFTRMIRVKKRGATAPKVGIDRFDEYIKKSGLEPKSYQREGVEFCLRRESSSCRRLCQDDDSQIVGGDGVVGAGVVGGIIADEMGLGKTIVMMGLILANLTMYRRTLIVVPVALIAQWVDQIKRTIIDTGVKPDLTFVVYHGSAGKRRVVLSEGGVDTVWCPRPPKRGGGGSASGKPIDIVITTYGCVAMEEPPAKPRISKKAGSVSTSLSLLTFRADRVIFDEAHHLRNKNSRMFKGAMRVVSVVEKDRRPSPSPSVWIVTGTPIQNKISDLKSLCYVLGFKVSDLMTEERRRAIRDEYVLRRTKVSVGMVSDVAAGVEVATAAATAAADVTCAPRLQSLKHYKMNVPWGSENELELSREIHQKARSTSDRAERLKLYTRMRQMCVWPALLTKPNDLKKKEESIVDGLEEEDTHGFALNDFNVAVSKQSKMDRVVATMVAEAEAAAGRNSKSIVFCHYRREMTRLRDLLLRSGCFGGDGGGSDDIAIIDGAVGPRERARIFATEPKVLILQIRTCSEGLNLQSYSDVYFVSPHWNPCVEDQAIARCYRMGQTQGVRVFRFYMTDFVAENQNQEEESECISTLDHKCEEIQERKRMLCNEFLCGGVM
jgi:SNF2 family DNA or RNA helicase